MTADTAQQLPRCHNDFRSDTFTIPTPTVLQAALNASLGDSVYDEDEDTLKLENYVAELTGKEAALFCVSGTLSNQIAIRSNLFQPPHSVLCDSRGHIYVHEAGGLATLSQAMVTPVKPSNGKYITLNDIIQNIELEDDIHYAPTKLISLENTIEGVIIPIDEIKKISDFAKANNLKLHLDGARLWNASIETGIPISEYCQYFDSVSLCLSKSLGAPIGSVLVGSKKFIKTANHFKKQNGGGIRQAGIITSIALAALKENIKKLKKSHLMAKELALFCQKHGIALELPVDTNFVFLDLVKNKMDPQVLIQFGEKYNVKLMGNRISFHFQISPQSLESVKNAILDSFFYAKDHPYDPVGIVHTYNRKLENGK
ncbi:threonine aldolase GLY1 ASCRUDRAFT_76326 [Ascoidea rubescens DSM 1968]|uniref:low-specificity L-threonine aldolase n=1 Tax=Ascoidea rubescens DSM 1968 TaxID=1344418 RepID=A0A1D2VF63_9ASCO|nr:hypothetical protein ASCRUDRAFT_76326 [Ascoidea rubescens DSM 1968]ODV60314.1 hypothetical protein ASCRUDRAFT_76326 [Ascoidea rubescens DSM 1968]